MVLNSCKQMVTNFDKTAENLIYFCAIIMLIEYLCFKSLHSNNTFTNMKIHLSIWNQYPNNIQVWSLLITFVFFKRKCIILLCFHKWKIWPFPLSILVARVHEYILFFSTDTSVLLSYFHSQEYKEEEN